MQQDTNKRDEERIRKDVDKAAGLNEARKEQPRGQLIVILAVGMVGFMVAAGMATDGGVLLMRQAQLERAVDTAALSGVTEMAYNPSTLTGCALCDERAREFLAVNGVLLDSGNPNHSFQSQQSLADLPGGFRYHIEVGWESEVYFMKLLGFGDIPLNAEATAEYYPMMDLNTSSLAEPGVVRETILAALGPASCSDQGDPISPTSSTWHGLVNPAGVYTYRIMIPPDYGHDNVRVEIFDPDSYNRDGEYHFVGHPNAGPGIPPGSGTFGRCPTGQRSRWQNCLIPTTDTSAQYYNPYWFVRIDRHLAGCFAATSYNAGNNPQTRFRLFYLRQTSSGRLEEVDLAYYTGKADGGEAALTDMMWISPTTNAAERMPTMDWGDYTGMAPEPTILPDGCGTCIDSDGDFIVNLNTEVPNIYTDPESGARHLYLQVQTLNSSTENGFGLWAGPPRSAGAEYVAPSNANARNIWIIGGGGQHDTDGVVVTGLGYMAIDSMANGIVNYPLAYIDEGYAGETIHVQLYDFDHADVDQPIYFYFDTISRTAYAMCYDLHNECNIGGGLSLNPSTASNIPNPDQWVSYALPVPEYTGPMSIPYLGGYLMVYYDTGRFDTFTWRMATFSRPYLVQ